MSASTRHLHSSLSALLLCLCLSSPALYGQLAPTDASKAIRDLNLPRLAPDAPGTREPRLKDESTKPSVSRAGKGPVVQVAQVILLCADPQVADTLRPIAAKREGRACDYAELESMIGEMRDTLSAAGFVGFGVWFPRQDITGGVIKVQVDLPKLGGTIIVGEAAGRASWSDVLTRSGVRSGAYLKSENLERGLLMIERYEGYPVKGLLRPGSAEGLVDLSLQPTAESVSKYGVYLDNHGSRYTGAARAIVSAETRGLTSLADHLSASGAFSEGMDYGSLQYAFFPSSNGLRFGVSVGLMKYRIIEGALAGTGVEGHSAVYGFGASYPLVLNAEESLSLELKVDDRAVLETTAGSERGHKRISSAGLGLQYASRSATTATTASFGISTGELRQLNGAAAAQDEAGPGTVGGYSKVKAEFVRQWATSLGVLLLGFEGQYAFQNLDSSEELSAGGPYGVRAYPVGEGSIDTGILCRAELTRPVGSLAGWGFDGGVFADFGYFSPNNERYGAYAGPERYHLAGWGLMLTGRSSDKLFFKTFISNRLGTNQAAGQGGTDADGRASDWRIWAQAGFLF